MKKHYLAALAVTAILGLGASGTALAAASPYLDVSGIIGSPHDFSDNVIFGAAGGTVVAYSEQWNFRKEICRVCHAPHDKQRNAYQAGLLWNRNLSSATYDTYTFSEKAGNGDKSHTSQAQQPVGRAKMCLSCHDNTVALGQFDNYADGGIDPESLAGNTRADGASTMQQIYDDGHFMIGNNDAGGLSLKGTHPISVSFAAGYRLKPVTSAMGLASGTIADVLDNGLVQCSSCHDVHNRVSAPGTHLLRVSQTAPASGLCLTCHDK
ncbi:MAG: cytochrome c3 family protein [Gallionella sp.]|nr:cytochrome c3 family protein [Gallionella sp.]